MCATLGSGVKKSFVFVSVQTSASSRKSQDAPSWPGVYRLSMSLMERLLKTLRYNFLTEALDFVGVHQERILQVCHIPPLRWLTWLLCCSSSGNLSVTVEALKRHSCCLRKIYSRII